MPDRPSAGARTLGLAIAGLLAAHASIAAPRLIAQERQQQATPSKSVPLTLTSDVTVLVVDVNDAVQLAQGVNSVITSQVPGVDVVSDSAGTKLRITPGTAKGNAAPLFVIDGVPLADGYGLTIRARSLERIDIFRDAASTAPYGLRASNGVVLIATGRRP